MDFVHAARPANHGRNDSHNTNLGMASELASERHIDGQDTTQARAQRVATPARQFGFTLIELAVALVIITLLVGGVLLATRVQLTQRQTSETRQALEETREALLAYAAANGRLPCPASSGVPGRGSEDCSASAPKPATLRGLVPWEELGIRAIDGWNRRLGYIVTQNLTSTGITLATQGSVVISAGTATGNLSLASSGAVAAAVWSLGANGNFGTLSDGTILPGADASADEQANNTAKGTVNNTIVSRDESQNPTAPGGTFDDQVIWVSRFMLFSRMMTAGQLP